MAYLRMKKKQTKQKKAPSKSKKPRVSIYSLGERATLVLSTKYKGNV